MGLDINGTKFLLFAREHGVSFSKTAMIGRQEMMINAADLLSNLTAFGYELTVEDVGALLTESDKYAEPFLKLLGAEQVVSFDASAYENASILHDFNVPVPDEHKNQFSVVLDGGTLEHVFNYPTAIKNCMQMVAEGGHFLGITPANNQLGHGFYQFSPELFFRVFSQQNGFEIKNVIIFEETLHAPWYLVSDPDAVKERVQLVNGQPSMLLIVAKKIKSVEIFEMMPQQSDYASVWNGDRVDCSHSYPSAPSSGGFRKLSRLPFAIVRRIGMRLARFRGMLNRRPKHFKKIDP